jgi:uncharacterized protein (TIGR02186 family)
MIELKNINPTRKKKLKQHFLLWLISNIKSLLKFMKLIIVFLLFLTNVSFARPIISGISPTKVEIDTNFTGINVLLFGSKSHYGDLVIMVKGPKKDYIINKKDKIFGIWHNQDRVKVKNIYSYYAFFSTNDDYSLNYKLFPKIEAGENNILFSSSEFNSRKESQFKIEFIKIKKDNNLYYEHAKGVNFLDEQLFKVKINFPKNIPSGDYSAEIYLINNNNISAYQTIPIYVRKIGLSSKIYQMAHKDPYLYGFIAIFLALLSGILANFVFKRLSARK